MPTWKKISLNNAQNSFRKTNQLKINMNMLEVQENFALGTTFCDMKIKELQTIQKFASNDARLTYFRKCSQINDTARLSCDFYQRYMLTDVYWRERFPNHIISNKNKQKISNGYEQSIRTNYLLENYSAFESSIRIIVQTYKSKKYEKLRYSFEKLFVWFMKELKRENSIPIFKFLRTFEILCIQMDCLILMIKKMKKLNIKEKNFCSK